MSNFAVHNVANHSTSTHNAVSYASWKMIKSINPGGETPDRLTTLYTIQTIKEKTLLNLLLMLLSYCTSPPTIAKCTCDNI